MPACLQCVPAHRLVEHTRVLTPPEIRKHHAARLRDNKHLRYMWIPGTDAVVVVTCNELAEVSGRDWWLGGRVGLPGAGPVLCFAVVSCSLCV